MLKSIEIRNFKAIGDEALKLENLAQVNYLIGPNGSGKSSVLEAIRFVNTNIFEDDHYLNLQSEYDKFYQKLKKLGLDYLGPLFMEELYSQQLSKLKINGSISLLDKNGQLAKINRVRNKIQSNKNIRFNTLQLFSEVYRSVVNRNTHFASYIYREVTGQMMEDGLGFIKDGNNLSKAELLETYQDSNVSNLNIAIESMHRCFVSTLSITSITDFEQFILKNETSEIRDNLNELQNFLDIITFSPQGTFLSHSRSDGQQFLLSLTKLIKWITITQTNEPFILCIEEPEKNLHPQFCKLIPKIIEDLKNPNIQFLISTHSPFIINSALELDREKYENSSEDEKLNFQPTHKVYHLKDGKNGDPEGEGITADKSYVSGYDNILGSIGVQPSDLLFANGIVWVEGPIDSLYFEKWLNLYAKENDLPTLKNGRDFTIQCLSPAGWSYASLENDFNKEYEAEEVIKLAHLNRNNYLIIDSDTDLNLDGTSQPSEIHHNQERKLKLLGKFGVNSQITKGTVENYLYKIVGKSDKNYTQYKDYFSNQYPIYKKINGKKELIKHETLDYYYISSSSSKTKLVKEIYKDDELKFSDFCDKDDELYLKIKALYNTIQLWNSK